MVKLIDRDHTRSVEIDRIIEGYKYIMRRESERVREREREREGKVIENFHYKNRYSIS